MTGPLNHLLASSPMPNMDYPGNAEARMLATASKRKLQRVRGAVAKLAALDPSTLSRNYERELVRAEEEVSRAHRDLTSQLEKLDGGDLLKRTRAEWDEAGGMTEYVRRHAVLYPYLPTIEAEQEEARDAWMRVQPAKEELRRAKGRLARVQGGYYALLELGFQPADEMATVVSHQLGTWREEEARTEALVHEQRKALVRRREQREAWHRQQGELKAAERFGEVAAGLLGGVDAVGLRRMRLGIMERDAQHLRGCSKATLRALEPSKAAHTQTKWALHCATGSLSFLAQLSAQACDAAQLHAEEYEASLEVSVLKATLDALAPRAAAAMHRRLAWHAAVGAHEVAATLGAPSLPQLSRQLADAQASAMAAEPVLREQTVLEAKLAKLEGKLRALTLLKGGSLAALGVLGTMTMLKHQPKALTTSRTPSASASAPGSASAPASAQREMQSEMQSRIAHEMRSVKLEHLRLTMKAADLGLALLRYDKAQANAHAAGGALVGLRRLQTSAADLPRLQMLASPLPPVSRAGGAGALTPEMRGFVRAAFGPLLRAATQQLLLRTPDDPYGFLVEWLYSVSASAAELGSSTLTDEVTEEDLALRRQELSAVHAELARLLRQIAMALPAAEQAASASTMLDYLVAPLPSDALHFEQPSASSTTGEVHLTPAALSLRPAGSPQLATANTALLDALCAVLAQHPRVQLRVAVPRERGLSAAARELARARERAVRAALQERGVAAARVLLAGEAKAGEAKAGEAKAGEAKAGGGGGLSADDGAARGDGAGGAAGAAGAVGADAALLELLPEAKAASRGDTVGGDAVASAAAGSAGLEARWAAACALATRREAGLQQARLEFAAVRAQLLEQAPAQLHLPRPVPFEVCVRDVRLSPAQLGALQPGGLQPGGGGVAPCIAFGEERCFGASVELEASDLAVDEIEIELWDGTRSRLLGSCCLALLPLLDPAQERSQISAELRVTGPGGGHVAELRATAAKL